MTNLWLRWQTKILAALSVVVAAVAVYFKIKHTGRIEERLKTATKIAKAENANLKQNLQAVEKRDEISRSIDASPPGDASKRLRDEWSRD